MANTKDIVGYRVMYTRFESFVHTDANGFNFMDNVEPAPISRGDAFRRLAGVLDQRPDLDAADFTVVPVYRERTPMEKASGELADLLEGLCDRHGLDLGLSREQMEAQIAKELADFGVSNKSLADSLLQKPWYRRQG